MKRRRSIDDLAIFGEDPLFDEALHVGRPNVPDREGFLARVNALLDRGWLTNDGPLVRELERRIADLLVVEHCIAVCNATLGLELLLRACGLDGEVILPSFTFIATAHAVKMAGLTPVFADIEDSSHGLDPKAVEPLVSERTRAILGVHLWGKPCATEALSELAGRHGLTLLYDAAHAFACSHRGRWIGGFGRAEVFSFHATKFLNSFEGGAVTTDDGDLADRLRRMRNFGFVDYDDVQSIGTNAKMNEVAAAMGLTSLDAIERIVAANRANYECYSEALAGVPGIQMLPYEVGERNNYQYVVAQIDERATGLGRDEILRILHAENVLARRYFFPGCHRMEPYYTLSPAVGERLPVTEQVAGRVLQLPTGTTVGSREIRAVAALLRLIMENSSALRQRLETAPPTIAPSGGSSLPAAGG